MSKNQYEHDWTDERLAEAEALWTAGCSAGKIAKILGGLTRSAVLGKLYRVGHKRPGEVEIRRLNAAAKAARAAKAETPAPAKPAKTKTPQPAVGDGLAGHNLRRKLAEVPIPIPPLRDIIAASARPWLTRKAGECTWPVHGEGADVWSCCAPIYKASWCRGHFAIGAVPAKRLPYIPGVSTRRRAA